MQDLTHRQSQVLEHIRERVAQGEPPTIREIGDALGMRSTNAVASHIRALQAKGLLTEAQGKSRALRPTDMGVDPLRRQRDQIKQVMDALGVPLIGDGLPDDWASRCIAAARRRRR